MTVPAAEIAELVSRRQGPVRFLLFAAGLAGHPLDDQDDVFAAAVEDLGGDAVLLGETPLLFAGLHAKNLFARRQESVGFLVTDQAVHVRDAPSTPFEPATPRAVPLLASPDPAEAARKVVRTASATFDRKWAETLSDPGALREALDVVREVIEKVLESGGGVDKDFGPDDWVD
ncbi:hypothetical protein QFZ52_000189 [Arthrobacter woluwensis]|uniref:hypothetical protein n=1 Tax=Arthrobacter woluwensis TaxID=156980 RepID=UPI0027831732|nr:hypothetical protein [Arthrobacter woluwensis]MDQ0707537.1 hypothetical protein [Arthrobacter woluwensis]